MKVEELKFHALWTPQSMAEKLLFPKPDSIQNSESKLKFWALDVVERNQPIELIKKAEELCREYEAILKRFNYERKLKGDDELDYQTLSEFHKLLSEWKGASAGNGA